MDRPGLCDSCNVVASSDREKARIRVYSRHRLETAEVFMALSSDWLRRSMSRAGLDQAVRPHQETVSQGIEWAR